MDKLKKILPLLALALVAGALLVSSSTLVAQGDSEARKAKILANLKLTYPTLGQPGVTVTMGELKPSAYAGLDEGTFTLKSQRGEQQQLFLVSSDDTKFYLVSAQIDVSRSEAEIQTEIAKREEAEAKKATEMAAKLDQSTAGLPVRGNPNGPVTIVEFSDFQCPYCSRGADTMEQVLEKYGEDVKFVFKHFPLNFHPWAKPAAIASHCAGLQDHDAFWTLHDKYFEDQKEINPGNVLAKSKEYLAGSDIDMGKWSICAENKESEEYKAAAKVVDEDMALGQQLGVSGTPGFFVNGQFLNGAVPLAQFEPLIEKAKSGM